MTFRRLDQESNVPVAVAHRASRLRRLSVAVAFCGAFLPCGLALAENPMAVIPKETIYPGQVINASSLETVEVTNPNLTGDYAHSVQDVVGKITNRTLLAGRVIIVSALRDPYVVERGKAVRIVYSNGPLTITAGGAPLENAAIGDLIRVRNTDSGIIVQGTVMQDGTIQVVAK
ncbi:flagella basal body P-ring formation protein FlgA [Pararhizobium capsulatum DSM 1112]|uniref:Flagella basal body P-ring formation protein FlgA n=1 Tax=Pararhizobium capsulatum DSM 1112 TaxID=1121113 RepID=A0ABU0BLN4_9HYPH|nr:flagellar basal body P-ring formation chaperone FlgA [Pararhizobium capsulatum]MDQ0319154.1 flagella basal body P-ring formation protein FlgA [Pararhizobium capsulatum DSM 1112]